MSQTRDSAQLSKSFGSASNKSARKAPPAPFSLRLSADEKAQLKAEAGSKPLGAYIRERLLGRDVQRRRKSRALRADNKLLAQILAELGGSRIASNLNQIAKAANMGALPVSPDLEAELQQACREVRDMRSALIDALGLKS